MAHRFLLVGLTALAMACGTTTGIDQGPMIDDGPEVDCTGRPTASPETRGEVNGVFDEQRQRILVYGGDTAAPIDCIPMFDLVDELWAFNLDCNNWEQLEVSGGPGIRARHATTLDTQRNRMLFFGGRTRGANGVYTNYNDVWALDLETMAWTEVATTGAGPTVRSSAAIAYDAANDRMIVFGGNVSTSGLTLTGVSDTFALDLESGAWTELAESGAAPGGRLYHGSVVVDGTMYVYGGTPNFNGPFWGDLWAFNLANDTWTELSPGGTGAPVERFGPELFHDAANGRLIMAMGHDAGPPVGPGNLNDVWAWDLAEGGWTLLQPGDSLENNAAGFCDFPPDFTEPQDNSPERRYSFVHVQDADNAYLFGGKTDCGNINDVWSLSLASGEWTSLRPPTGGEACNRSGRVDCTTLCF